MPSAIALPPNHKEGKKRLKIIRRADNGNYGIGFQGIYTMLISLYGFCM